MSKKKKKDKRDQKRPSPVSADESRPSRYEGYDENKASSDPNYQADYDVDEDDSSRRLSEYQRFEPTVPDSKSK